MAVQRNTGPTTLHDLELRVLALEINTKNQHDAEMLAIRTIADEVKGLREDLSGHGAPPVPKNPPAEDAKPGRWPIALSIAPGTAVEVAKIAAIVVPILAGVWGASYSGASAGGASGASGAVEDAVQAGEAVPVAAPVVRVMPVPIPHPVPVPAPPPPEPEPPVVDDLLPQGVP